MKEEDEDSQEYNQGPANPPNPIPENTQQERKIQVQFSIVDKWKEIMKAIKEKTGIDGIYVILFLLVCVILVYLGIFGTLITNMVGTLYPGFSTIKAMEKNQAKKKEWLTYWVVFGFFIIVDMFSGIIMKIIPFYFVLKILFLIWMFLPGSSGCFIVYNYVILKLFKSIEDKVDFFFDESKKITSQVSKDIKKGGVEKMKQISKGFKTFKGSLLKNKGGGSMEDALKAAEELEKEENEINNKNVLRGKPQKNDDYSGALKSNIVSFPNKMENKYFKEQLNDIVKEKEKNEIKEVKEENNSEFMSNIVLNNKSSEDNKEEEKLDKEEEKKEEKKEEEKKEEKKEEIKEEIKEENKEEKKEEEKQEDKKEEEKKEEKQEEKKEEEKKEEEKKEEEKKEEGETPQDKNFSEQIDDLEKLLTGDVFGAEENKGDDGEKKPEDNNNGSNKDNNQ